MTVHDSLRTFLAVSICLLAATSVAHAQYSGGTGEPNDPYQIATAEDLIQLGETPDDYDKHFILTADIDLDPNLPGGRVFDRAVIAPDTNDVKLFFQGIPFTGSFNGKGYTISRLTIVGDGYLGLFGNLEWSAVISNLGLEAVDIDGTDYCVGSLTGRNEGGCITASYCTGEISGYNSVGGLVGSNQGTITAGYCTGLVRGNRDVGGLVGDNGGYISNSSGSCLVSGGDAVGGLVGFQLSGYTANSYSTGKVSGGTNVGGLVGEAYQSKANIISSFWDTQASEQMTSDGGVGLTTIQMQDIDVYLNAGWDFVDEVINGTCEYWEISSDEYPQLRYVMGQWPAKPEGLGTAERPYLIRDAQDLGSVWFEPTAHFRLENSIDLAGITFSVAVVPSFAGVFDGNDHTISHLTIAGGSYLGLFGQLAAGAEVSNLHLEVADVNGVGSHIGVLAGYNLGRVAMCYSTGTVNGERWDIGGLVGSNGGWPAGAISNCHSNCTVNGGSRVAGLVGYNGGTITNSHSTGVTTGTTVGGLAGYNDWPAIITACYSSGTVNGSLDVTPVAMALWRYRPPSGGLVGENSGSITRSYSEADVTGSIAGGLAGRNYYVGEMDSIDGNIAECYSTGKVTGREISEGWILFGGLVGDNDTGTITTSYWDIETSGQDISAGGIGKTSTEMQTATTFLGAGWDFVGETENGPNDVWKIVEGQTYPLLSWQKYGGGTGEPNDPYLIYTAEHLNALGAESNDYDEHFKLMADIDLSGYSYDRAVIAPDVDGDGYSFPGTPFTGVFDGNGHAVLHLTITGKSYLGLFGKLGSGAEVKDLGVVDVNITGSYYAIGGLVGDNFGGSTTTCYSTGTVTGYTYVGGLVGYNEYGDIATSYSTAAVGATFSGNQKIGGLVGVNAGRTTTSYSTGTVSGQRHVGGLAGHTTGSITMCYSTGTVSGETSIGGLVGSADRDNDIIDCFWDIQTSGQTKSDGGTGPTTAEMQTASTFLEAGWDFIDEIENGTEDIWWILEGRDYPRLWWELVDEEPGQ